MFDRLVLRAAARALVLLMAGVVVSWAPGCIPEAPKEKPEPAAPAPAEAPAPSDEAGLPAVEDPIEEKEDLHETTASERAATEAAAQVEDGQSGRAMSLEDADRSNAAVQVTPKADGKGFDVRGTFEMSGDIVPKEGQPGQWRFQATFRFPTDQYAIGEPFFAPLGTLNLNEAAPSVQIADQMILITVPIAVPSDPASTGEKRFVKSTQLDVPAPDDVQFTVVLISG